MKINYYVLIIVFSSLLTAYSQILLKQSANKKHISIFKEYFNPYVIFAYIIFFFVLILNVIGFKGIEFKNGPIIGASSYIFVLIMSKILLKENLTKRNIAGNALIIIGIIIFNL